MLSSARTARIHTRHVPCETPPFRQLATTLGGESGMQLLFHAHHSTNKGQDGAHNLQKHIFFGHQFFSIDLEAFRGQCTGIGHGNFEMQLLAINQQ